MSIKRKVSCILWDLDGTLLDTETVSTKALQKVVEPFEKTIEWSLKKKLLGLRGEDWSPIVIKDLGLDGLITCKEVMEGWENGLNTFLLNVDKLPGALQLLSSFKKKYSLPQALATSSFSTSVKVKQQLHPDLFEYFETVVCGDDVDLRNGKPAPDIFILAASRLGFKKEEEIIECLVFEDSLTGVKAAKAAGMMVVAIPDSRLDKKIFYDAQADLVLNSLIEFDFDFFSYGNK